MTAAYNGYAECIKTLLKKGADPKAKDKAARMGHLGCVVALLVEGANLEVKDKCAKAIKDKADETEAKDKFYF
eukprot:gene9733-7607_t